ncbi:Rne/Rng family ribonuclease [Candidatus Acetothermia bacterium]|nr:Rne/Rng family ribonuclease [Candidatus Acetothermia bacterium]
MLEDSTLMEIYYGHPAQEKIVGNIYHGRVEDVLPGLGSAFIDIGEKQSLFLSQSEISEAILEKKKIKAQRSTISIDKILRRGETLIIQVRRGGIGTKNPQGTTKISLPGRFWVFLPTDDRLGVSRRIVDEKEERRLRKIAQSLKQSSEGLIIRTAAQQASRDDLERDYRFLASTWQGIEETAASGSVPRLLYRGMGLIQSILRDRLLPDVSEVVVDSARLYEKILQFLNYMKMDEYAENIRLYEGKVSLFEMYDVERQIQQTFSRRVDLKGGGYLTIDETEALTAIDVNTGGDVRYRNQAAAILNANIEAAEEIPRQLQLRKISGIIIVDFVDVENESDMNKVITRLREGLNRDRMPANYIDTTALGLVEITRKREGESLADMLEHADFKA